MIRRLPQVGTNRASRRCPTILGGLLSNASIRAFIQPILIFLAATSLLAAATGQRTHAVPNPLPKDLCPRLLCR